MSGSATLTTVMSSSNMKIASDTATSVHHLRSNSASFVWGEHGPGRGSCLANYMKLAADHPAASRRCRPKNGTMRVQSSCAGCGR